MQKIVECVPNFSEGRDNAIIEAIVEPIRNTKGVKLLGVDPDKDYNRVVVTFAGEPESVLEAAFRAAKRAIELIDMTKHKGEHPRIGAVDVVPFVPIKGVTMAECVELSNRFAKRAAEAFGLPVYLYEESARNEKRKPLSNIRQGEYEGLPEKLKDPDWQPDYGPAVFVPRSGAIVTGARFFLIAYNVNLRTTDKEIANEIAKKIRESGYKTTNEKGETVRVPGRLKSVKAIGVYLDNYKITQVSMNLTNYTVTPPHIAYEEVKKEAKLLGVEVSGSEIIGLVPEEALLMAGRFYSKQKDLPPAELIQSAIDGLGLSDLYPFEPDKKIIEYML